MKLYSPNLGVYSIYRTFINIGTMSNEWMTGGTKI
jgi:hypothetical protein